MRLRDHPAIGEGRIDILYAKPAELLVDEGYNVRDFSTKQAREKLDELKAQVKEHGIQSPLKVRFDGTDIFIVEGHRRQRVVLELIEEFKATGGKAGRDIELVPIYKELPGTSDLDREYGLETSNSGEQLTALERADLIYRIQTQRGQSIEKIAAGMGKSVPVIKNHLKLRELPEKVKQQIRDGDIAWTFAIQVMKETRDARQDPEFAAELIRNNKEENKRLGVGKRGGKVTRKTLARAKKDAEPKPIPEAKAPQPDKQPEPPPEAPPQPPAHPEPGQGETVSEIHAGESAAMPDTGASPVAGSDDGHDSRLPPSHFSPLADEAPPAPEPVREPIDEPSVRATPHGQLNGFFEALEPFAKALEGWDLNEMGDDGTVLLEVKVPDAKRFSAAWNKATGATQ